MSTVPAVAIFITGVLVTMVTGELLMRKLGVRLELSRKTFHLLAGTICIVMSLIAAESLAITIVGALFVVGMPLTMWLGWFKIQSRKRGFGTMTFSLGLVVLSLWFWEPRVLIITAMVILTYADGFAAVVGSLFGKRKYQVGHVVKSLEGSITFFLVALVGVAVTLSIYQTGPISDILLI
ncbi:MAG: hypothetical protein V3T05_08395, partial [Myxococcota bacterium]